MYHLNENWAVAIRRNLQPDGSAWLTPDILINFAQ